MLPPVQKALSPAPVNTTDNHAAVAGGVAWKPAITPLTMAVV